MRIHAESFLCCASRKYSQNGVSIAHVVGLVQDYKPTPYLIEHVHLDFLLNEDKSTVKSKLSMTPNYKDSSSAPKLELDGMILPGLVQIYASPLRVLPFADLKEQSRLLSHLHQCSACELQGRHDEQASS